MVESRFLWHASKYPDFTNCYYFFFFFHLGQIWLIFYTYLLNYLWTFRGGICIWTASYPGNAASVRSGSSSFLGALSRGSGTRWTLVDFFRSPHDEQISALSWSPDGRYPY